MYSKPEITSHADLFNMFNTQTLSIKLELSSILIFVSHACYIEIGTFIKKINYWFSNYSFYQIANFDFHSVSFKTLLVIMIIV